MVCKISFISLFFFAVILKKNALAQNNCVWYGVCDTDLTTGLKKYCHDTKPPRRLDDAGSSKLQSICPELVNDNGVALTCCNDEQVQQLINYIRQFESYLSDSAACWNNFKNYYCHLHCGQNQSAYVFPQKLGPHKNLQHFTVLEVEYMIKNSYAEGFFNSCVDAVDRLTGLHAIDLLCGSWNRQECDASRWLNHMGDPQNKTSPFLTNVTLWNHHKILHRRKYFYPLDLTLDDESSGGTCEWYGECGDNPVNHRSPINCYSSKASKVIPNQSTKQFESICPELINSKGLTRTCCDADQIRTLKTFLGYSYQHLSECASCWHNYRQFFCHLTCSPNQNEFVRASKTISTTDNKTAVVEVEYLINGDFASSFYESCRVATTSTGMKVMDVMCGSWGHEQCTINRWLEHLGDNSHTPFITGVSLWNTHANITKDGRIFSPMSASAEHFSCHKDNVCVWYGQCGTDPDTGLRMNCYDFNPPRYLQYQKTINHLKNVCPELINDKNDALTCCDRHQISTLVDNLALLSSLTSHCPACYHNLRLFFCKLSCSPMQSDFMYPQKIIPYQDRSAVKQVGFLISRAYSEGLFNSCASVHHPQTKAYVMDYLCGQWGEKFCTSSRLLDSLGSRDIGISSYVTNYTFWSHDVVHLNGKTFYPLNEPFIKCNQRVMTNGASCTCEDCNEACI